MAPPRLYPPGTTRAQQRRIKEIRSRGLSASYEKRLIRGVLQGKTRQEARGHHAGEARERRERERAENNGISHSEERSIRKWYERFNPNDRKTEPDVEDVIQFARDEGIEKFREYQKVWNAARRTYLRELKNGTYESRGLPYLEMLTDMAGIRSHGDIQWLYYH